MVSALDSGLGGPGSSPGRGTALCSWARHSTLILPLSTQVDFFFSSIIFLFFLICFCLFFILLTVMFCNVLKCSVLLCALPT